MRPKPILSLTLLAAALAMPGMAASVGLGKLTLQSSLGQPLSAQIELTSVAPEELGSVTARIADSSVYRQNNLAYQGVLSRARVTMERLPSGDAILKVTTSSSVVEPYLDLLIEVNWASGRVVRAYTFLLDPPGMPAAPAIDPVTPARVGAPRAAAAQPVLPASSRRERPPTHAEQREAVTRCGAAIRCRASPRKPGRAASRWSRCWLRSSTATRERSTATT